MNGHSFKHPRPALNGVEPTGAIPQRDTSAARFGTGVGVLGRGNRSGDDRNRAAYLT